MCDARFQLAAELMQEHGLVMTGNDAWQLRCSRGKNLLGFCQHRPVKRISLSSYLLWYGTDDEFIEIVLHEIAHALAGPGQGHGPKWQAIAKSIGCTGKRCLSGTPFAKRTFKIECPCGKVCVTRFVVKQSTRDWTCRHCNQRVKVSRITN